MTIVSEIKPNKQFPIITFTRRIVQIASFIVVNFLILETLFNINLSIFKENLLIFPFLQTPRDSWANGSGILEVIFFAIGHGDMPYFYIGLFFIIVLLTSRFFCGWVCPVGAIQDLLSGIPAKARKMNINTDKNLKKVKFWIVGILLIIMIFFSAVYHIDQIYYYEWNESLGTFLQRPLSGFSLSEFIFYTLLDGIHDAWVNLNIRMLFNNVWDVIGFIFYIIILIVAAYYPRFYCRVLCPYGAASGFISEYSVLKFSRNPAKCKGRRDCGICEKVCPMQIRLLDEPFEGFTGNGECILCGRCKEACPFEAVNLKFG